MKHTQSNNVIIVRTMSLTRRSLLGCLAAVLVIAAVLVGCGNKETGEALAGPPLSPSFPASPMRLPSDQPTVQPTPTLFVFGPLVDPDLDLKAGPVEVPLELQIPSLKVNAPVLGVGLTSENVMDAPKGPIGDPVWHTVFWYRGGGIPGDVGTATIAGHVNDPLGRPAIFAHLEHLQPGDLIIVHLKNTTMDIRFIVDQIKVYSIQESSDPAVLTQVYGAGPVAGTGPQPAPDGLSHLTLVTCAGDIVNGELDQRIVVYATRTK
jgi:hypothetical protein